MSCNFFPDHVIDPSWRPLQDRVAAQGTALGRLDLRRRLPGNMDSHVPIAEDARPSAMARCLGVNDVWQAGTIVTSTSDAV